MLLLRFFDWLIPGTHPLRTTTTIFVAVLLVSLGCAVGFDSWWPLLIPAGCLVAWVALVDYKPLFFLMLACIPISTEIELPGGLATDLPSEPLMWVLMGAGTLWLLRHYKTVDSGFLRHPITLMLFLHLGWLVVASGFSHNLLVSFKFLLAKSWYVGVFYFLAGRLLETETDYKKMVWCFFIPLLFTVLVVLVKHYPTGFSFETVNYVLAPFYRNHVMYACLLAIFLPFVWVSTFWYRYGSYLWLLLAMGILIMLLGINFAYTRAAYGALVAGVGIWLCIRWKMIRLALGGFSLIMALFIGFVTWGDNYLLFAPDYERAITHQRFENLLEATTRLEDISVMERVYRWVAASKMLKEEPLKGFGPGNFYGYYRNYTVSSFKTYVSRNPERSGMHNYFLMTAVEQGLPGAIIFIALCFFAIIQGQKIYHRLQIAWARRMLVAAVLCFALIALLMLMNDFVETDKIGSWFFLSLAIMVNLDLAQQRKLPINHAE
jgi:O-antigen ligase